MELQFIILTLYLGLFAFLAWRNFNLALGLFFFLLPSYLIRFHFGPVPTTLLELMLFVIVGVWIIKEATKSLISNFQFLISNHRSLVIATSLFLLAATISIFTSINTRAAVGEWKAFYLEPILLFFILTSTQHNYQTNQSSKISNFQFPISNIILNSFILSGLATSLLAIYQHFTGWGVPWDFWENRNTFRVTGWYGFPNAVALFLAPLVPLAMYLVKQTWGNIKTRKMETGNWKLTANEWPIISNFLFLISSPFAVIFAKSTGGLIGIAAGIGTLFLFNKKTRLFACLVGLVGVVILVRLPSSNSIRQELLAQNRSGQIRIEMWGETVQYLSEHPLTGAGLASYATVIAPYRINKHIEIFHHPHNIFLTIWVNLGILGLVGFVWILVWFYRVAFENWKLKIENSMVPFLVAAMTTILVTGLVDSPYIKNDLAIFFWTLIALHVVSHRNNLKIENL